MERRETENILFQQSSTKSVTRKERIGTFYRNFHRKLKKYFSKFTAEGFSETRPLMHLSKQVFRSQ